MPFQFDAVPRPDGIRAEDWQDWRWQFRHAVSSITDFEQLFSLTPEEREGFRGEGQLFKVLATPYYAHLARRGGPQNPVRQILMPHQNELAQGFQQMHDPLGERAHSPVRRVIHRYPDRCLLLVTDQCSVYCRYCTRKHFTAHNHAAIKTVELDQALDYISSRPGLREVILSGGDPLTLGDPVLQKVIHKIRSIPHVEIIRIGTRIPVVNPWRITDELLALLKPAHPIYIMTHFNHPREITQEAAQALTRFVDHGFPVFNQMVLLNGINNHPAIVQALCRRLLYLRVKPYYMFQCDPSEGTDHLRTSVDQSLSIQRELWGRLSGLAMPNLSLDIPDGGGKAPLVPDFQVGHSGDCRYYKGWDGLEASYISPPPETMRTPADVSDYEQEWEQLKATPYGRQQAPSSGASVSHSEGADSHMPPS